MNPIQGPTPAAPAVERHDWMDYAKGICIVAVVVMYSANHIASVLGSAGWMQLTVDFMQPFRMPDFFFVSGLLLSRVIDRPWRGYLDKKVVHYLYFFVLWSLLYFAARVAWGSAGHGAAALWNEFVKVMTWGPFAMLWFVQMLPFYFLLTRITRRVPAALVFVLAAGWHLADVNTGWSQVDRSGERFVFFFAGYWLAPVVFRYARFVMRRPLAMLAPLAAWAGVNGWLVFAGFSHAPFAQLALGLAGAFAVITVAAMLQRRGWLDALRHCGQHSLAIYLGFFWPMAVLTGIYLAATRRAETWVLDAGVAVMLISAASIVLALWAARAARGTRLGWLYERPRWARMRPVRTSAASAAAENTAPA